MCDVYHPCASSICQDPVVTEKRINGQVRVAASMRTMMMSAHCTNASIRKDPKHASYDRVYKRAKSAAMFPKKC